MVCEWTSRLKLIFCKTFWRRLSSLLAEENSMEDEAGREGCNFNSGSFSMNNDLEFQMVCWDCGSLAIKIENPVSASRETIVHCGECGASRGTIGALRDLAVRANVLGTRQRSPKEDSCSELVSLHNELQTLRRRVQMAESVGTKIA